jgi:hypothetical protein
MTTATKHTATKLNRPGSTPRYEYRGITISASAGSSYGRGWLAFIGLEPFYLTTLQSAKDHVDAVRERQAAEYTGSPERRASCCGRTEDEIVNAEYRNG